ncbi:MAG: hypothetical protein OXH57_01360 [Ekhidna sp.]|nr:hypothetical protein [Ekhidna sp.]
MNRPENTPHTRGLFGYVTGGISNPGLTNIDITAVNRRSTIVLYIGELIGRKQGGSSITNCYVSGVNMIGGRDIEASGLVDAQRDNTIISACYVLNVTGTRSMPNVDPRLFPSRFASLIGNQTGNSVVTACYAGGMDYEIFILQARQVSGLSTTVNYSYHQAASINDADAAVRAKTKAALQGPTDYTGIYADWDDLDADGSADSETFWDFGTGSRYPVLKGIDVNRDGNMDAADLAAQRP